jgi:23S rRNA (cytosine1962-C5)-methyltransferase
MGENMVATLVLKPDRQKSLLRQHPWIFSGAVAELRGDVEVGGTVEVVDYKGAYLATASYNPHSQIIGRVWSFNRSETIDELFFEQRLSQAIELRENLLSFSIHSDNKVAARLVHAESDGIPGLIVDIYSDVIVTQFLTAGIELWKETICDLLMKMTGRVTVFERSDVEARRLEGLPLRKGVVRGRSVPDRIIIEENGILFFVDVGKGHKTGFYLDQRKNRAKLRRFAKDKDILDCFCYSGGFTLNALLGGARSITAIDSSGEALALVKENITLNQRQSTGIQFIDGDVFQVLRAYRDRGMNFELIVLDPPKFAQTISQSQKAARGYKDINLLAFKLLRPGGYLATFSCSGGIGMDFFQKIVAGAALDAGVNAQIIERCYQDVDHPVALNFPEGTYLKGLILKVNPQLV